MLPSFLCLRRVMAHRAQKKCCGIFFFSCCESSSAVQPEFTAKSEKLKGQILHPLLLPEVVTQILLKVTFALLWRQHRPSQKCINVTFNPFITFFFEDHIPESPFLPHLNDCSPFFFYSLKRQLILMLHTKLTLCFAIHMFSHFPSTCLPYTHSLHSPKHCPAVLPFSSLLFSVIFQYQVLGPSLEFHV